MIHVESDLDPLPISAELVRGAALAALSISAASHPGRANGDLTVVLTDDAQLRQLNRDYLGIDAPTDVLSFPASETDPETDEHYFGDVLVSVVRAQAQARAAGHPLESEVQLLVVHGVLHLLGYDHSEAEEKSRMWSAQGEILKSIGLDGIKIIDS
jgi:probable rRNA maturation factor